MDITKKIDAILNENTKNPEEWGVRWKEFAGREGRVVTKEKIFKSQKDLDKFVEKLEQNGNFYEIDSWLFPKED